MMVEAYVELAQAEMAAGRAKNASEAITLADGAVSKVPDYMLDVAQANIAGGHVMLGDAAQAFKLAEKFEDVNTRNLFFSTIAEKQLELGQFDNALKTSEKIKKPFFTILFANKLASLRQIQKKRRNWCEKADPTVCRFHRQTGIRHPGDCVREHCHGDGGSQPCDCS